jgi:predicted DNA-binding protein with PD1-like motif
MKTAVLTEATTLLVLERGERVLETVTNYCQSAGIVNAWLRGLGAVQDVRCGYYDLITREYVFREYADIYEVLQLSGNVMLKEGVPWVHAHATFSDTANQCFGGHVAEMVVAVTLEVELTVYPTAHIRVHNAEIGLFLINPH